VENVNFKETGRRKPGLRSILKQVWEELTDQTATQLKNRTIEDVCEEYQRTSTAISYEI
jgi:DNA-binding IscR family transcriptional regulator